MVPLTNLTISMQSTTTRTMLLSRNLGRYCSIYCSTGRRSFVNNTVGSITPYPYSTPSYAYTSLSRSSGINQNIPPLHHSTTTTAIISGSQKSFISTTTPKSVVGWVQDKLAERQQNKKAAKLIDSVTSMANSEKWTIKDYANDINEQLSQWSTKIPGFNRTLEVQRAKEYQNIVNSMIQQFGNDITVTDMNNLDRKEKLKLVIACKVPMNDVDAVLMQFKQMDIMQRILRSRKKNGIPLPTDQESLKMAMQTDAIKVMTKEEKEEAKEMFAAKRGE